jgi:hypothetical protein
MPIFIDEVLEGLTRTREAIGRINSLGVEDRTKKQLLTEWFEIHTRAGPTREARHEAYNKLLGRERNRRLMG